MSFGEFLTFGAPCTHSSSLPHIPQSIRINNSFLVAREQNKAILPPHQGLEEPACIALTRLITSSLVLLEDGQVYDLDAFESFEPQVQESFRLLNALRLPIIDIAVGGSSGHACATKLSEAAQGGFGHFFLCLTAVGEVYVFGKNNSGQLGLGHIRDVIEPTRLQKFAPDASVDSNIARASQSAVPVALAGVRAGKSHSMAFTTSGSVYTWGRNIEGQTGLSMDANAGRTHSTLQAAYQTTPRYLHHLAGHRILSIAANNHLSLALTDDGLVFHWGYGLLQKQYNVPTPVEYTAYSTPHIVQIALGHAHALLLTEGGSVFSLGSTLSGALGLGPLDEKRVEKARRIQTSSQLKGDRVVRVEAGAFSSAFIDQRGRVHTFGSAAGGKLGHDADIVYEPTTLEGVADKVVSQLSLGDKRLVLFIPTKLSTICPGVISLKGQTALKIEGHGFLSRGDGDHNRHEPQVRVSFTYHGLSVQVSAIYNPLTDVIEVTSPDLSQAVLGQLRYEGQELEQSESAVLRASFDAGLHWTNALSTYVFQQPDFSPSNSSVTPAWGPVQGGSELALKAPFDLLPYENILVRFRMPGTKGDHQGIIGVVNATFDPVARTVKCVAPAVAAAMIPASRTDIPEVPRASRFIHPPAPSPPASRLTAQIEVSLDGQNFFPFPKSYDYYVLQATNITPGEVGLAGGPIRIEVQGVHFTNAIAVKFALGSFQSSTIPAVFLPLQQARAQARAGRETFARFARKNKADQAERARLAEIQRLIEEEENRDPKEKERIAREKEKAEKAEAEAKAKAEKEAAKAKEKAEKEAALQAKKEAAAASKANSRPGSAESLKESPSRPRSSTTSVPAGKSRVATPTKDGTLSPQPIDSTDSASVSPNVEAADSSAQSPAVAQVDTTTVVPLDEFDLEEQRIAAEEAEQDKQLALLSERDQAAVGYILVDAPPFSAWGACAPQLSLTLNKRDFVPISSSEVPFSVRLPQPLSLEPNCGPISGGTEVKVSGEYFYQARDIEVQVRPRAPAPSRPMSAVSFEDEVKSLPPMTARTAAAANASAAAAGGKKPAQGLVSGPSSHRKDSHTEIAPVVVAPPPAPQSVQATYNPGHTASSSSLLFNTPSWPVSGLAQTHVAFTPKENAPSMIGLPFRYYDPPIITDAHPMLISQTGGSEITLSGRGFVQSGNTRIRLVLHEEETEGKKGSSSHHKPLSVPSEATESRPVSGASSARKKIAAASAHAATIDTETGLPAGSVSPAVVKHSLELSAVFHTNDSPAELEELAAKRKKGGAAATGAGGKKKDGEAEPELATISFVTPMATAFNADFADPLLAANRGLEVELALNGQQFQPTGIILRFEKDNKLLKNKPKAAVQTPKK